MKRTGAQVIWECLVREGVDTVFGYPGGAILPAYDAMLDYPVRHVLVRHEQGAAHAADGYARASGRVGVAIGTSGPGATNLVTGIATAMLDSVPLVVVTGQVPSTVLGTDAFQEADIVGITMPITKHNVLVTHVADLAPALREAFAVARSGRPGPVLVDVCKDAQQASTDFVWPEVPEAARRRPLPAPRRSEVAKAAALLAEAERPLILAGHGVIESGATAVLTALAEKTGTPVALTLLGLGGFPRSHPLCLGMMGMHGEAYVNTAVQEADFLLAVGMRFDDRVTGNLKSYAKGSKKVHVELDPSELGKNVPVDVGILGDARAVLEALLPAVAEARHDEWLAAIEKGRQETRTRDILHREANGRLLAAHVIHDVWRATKGGAVVVSDVGQHQMFEAQYYPHEEPRTLLTSGGLGTMGFALPAAIGAKLARPEAEVWVVAGDGGFQMTQAELATLVQEKLDVKIAVVDNGYLGMVRQWQELFYQRRYAATPLLSPDFTKLAAAYGIPAHRVTRREEVVPTVEAVRQRPGPALVHFVVEPEEAVYPMVPAGAGLHAMLRRPAAPSPEVSA
ncbi:biosynthetic-type acetolactate synthase large subunit [Acidobacteria bacterium ACD]|nr:MAG: biosynthetic-type acetolactate synthase large subunit [Acidobacteriota bacterium]MDL1948245.1 biosynthetic-type acetolactate synthase large subunit [Acidobacteria bacterium ACD]